MGTERIARVRTDAEARDVPVVHRPRGMPDAVRSLSALIGNRAMGAVIARAPATAATAKADPDAPTAEEVGIAEEWLTYLAQRGVGRPKPTKRVPARYLMWIERFRDAVVGVEDEKKDRAFIADSKLFLEMLRRHHDAAMPKGADTRVFELAKLALDRSVANLGREGGEGAFGRAGATQLDQVWTLQAIWTRADEQLEGAKEAGYIIPKDLATLADEARARHSRASKGWDRGSPSGDKWITPADEQELVKFRDRALETIDQMRRKRSADWARARRAEAEAIEAVAEKELARLRELLADRRRGLFMAGETRELEKLHDATGEIVRAIDEMKHAAGLITKHVDRINTVAEYATKKGGPVINLPAVPKGLSDIAKQIKGAHSKIGTALKLLKLAGPAKTELDGGLKILEAAEMGLDHWAGKSNPIFAAYVNGYLGPGIRNCIQQIGGLANTNRSQNRGLLSDSHFIRAIYFNVEPGGEPVWVYLHWIFKNGPMPIAPTVYDYFDEHRDEISAAVKDRTPSSRDSIPAWAYRNRYALWETFYGSAKPPYDPAGR